MCSFLVYHLYQKLQVARIARTLTMFGVNLFSLTVGFCLERFGILVSSFTSAFVIRFFIPLLLQRSTVWMKENNQKYVLLNCQWRYAFSVWQRRFVFFALQKTPETSEDWANVQKWGDLCTCSFWLTYFALFSTRTSISSSSPPLSGAFVTFDTASFSWYSEPWQVVFVLVFVAFCCLWVFQEKQISSRKKIGETLIKNCKLGCPPHPSKEVVNKRVNDNEKEGDPKAKVLEATKLTSGKLSVRTQFNGNERRRIFQRKWRSHSILHQ